MRKAARRVAWIAGGVLSLLVLALVAAALIIPALIDRPDVRAGLQRRLSAAVGGEVSWEALHVGLLPLPHGELHRFHIGIPGKLDAAAERADLYLRFWPLLLGRPEIASVSLRKPQVRIETAGKDAGDKASPGFMGGYRAVATSLADALRRFAAEAKVEITGAEIELRRRGGKPFVLRDMTASAKDDAKGIAVEASAASGLWKSLKVAGRIEYGDLAARAQADVEGLDLPALLALAGEPLKDAGALEGRVSAAATFTIDSAWHAEVELSRSSAAFTSPRFPVAVRLGSGKARLDGDALRLERIAVSALDAKALVSGTIPFSPFGVELSVEEGSAGGELLRFALQRAGVPPRLEARSPVRFGAKRIAWAGRAAALDGQLAFDGGPQVAVALGWTPGRLELKRVAIKDAATDARFAASAGGGLVRGSFAGVLYGRSLAAMVKGGESLPGSGADRLRGELRFTLDQARPARSFAEGRLEVDELDLSALSGGRAVIQHLDLTSGRDALRIGAAKLDWRGQVVELRGEVRRTEQGPRIEARLESPGIVVDRLLADERAAKEAKPPKEAESKLWPLPVTGNIEVRAAFVEYRGRKVQPVEGSLSLEPRVARMELREAKLCGASFPLVVEAVPDRYRAAANVDLHDQPVEEAARCLTGGAMKVTGTANLTARLRTQGAGRDLLRNLSGTVQADLKKGRVDEFGLIANVLSVRGNVAGAASGQKGIPYRSISAKGQFKDGAFVVEEAFFDSDAARLAASGSIDMLGRETELTVLVGLLTRVDRVTGAIPIIGDVLGDSITALPVQVKGDIRDPVIVPLGPRAVTGHLLGIFERALKLPGKLVPAPDRKGDATPAAAPGSASPSSAAPSLPEPSSAAEPSPPPAPRGK